MINIYKAGTRVEIKLNKTHGIITSAVVRQNDVVYNVAYFVGEELKECSLYEFEFDVKENNCKQKIGFR